MELKCKKCGSVLSLEDVYDTDGGFDEGYIMKNRLYSCPQCMTDYAVGVSVPAPVEDNIVWFQEAWVSLFLLCE